MLAHLTLSLSFSLPLLFASMSTAGDLPNWAPAVLSLLLAGGRAKAVSARLSPSHSTTDVRGVCNFLGSVSPQQKFEAMDQRYSSRTDQCYNSMLQLSFIWKTKENTSSRPEGMPTQKTRREERERQRQRVRETERD